MNLGEDDGTILKTEEFKAKLRGWKGDTPQIGEFLTLLAGRLSGEVSVLGVIMGITLLCTDLHRGIDGFTGKPFKSGLVGLPFLVLFTMAGTAIAQLPPDFAKKVQCKYDAVLGDAHAP